VTSTKRTRSTETPNGVPVRKKHSRGKTGSANIKEFVAMINQERGRFSTDVDLAKAANIAPSTLSMIFKGDRAPSAKVVMRLAKAICPPVKPLDQFTKKMLKLAGYDSAAASFIAASESRVERILRTKEVRAAYISNKPFVIDADFGFATELFKHIANLMDVSHINWSRRKLSELKNIIEGDEADIIVSAVLPTFQRSSYMWFSKPFPYLRIPLSAIVQEDKALTVKHVIELRNKRPNGLDDIKILLIEGEVGDEFARAFLKGLAENPGMVERIESLEAKELYETLTNDPHLLLADMATCMNVCEFSKTKKLKFVPLPEDVEDKELSAVLSHGNPNRSYPRLASYPITFGLPKDDKPWKEMIDNALDSMMHEGARVLLALYQDYLKDKQFASFFVQEDELIASEPIRRMFVDLFKNIHYGLSPDSADELLASDPVKKAVLDLGKLVRPALEPQEI